MVVSSLGAGPERSERPEPRVTLLGGTTDRSTVRIATMIDPHAPGSADFAGEAERAGVASLWVPEG